MCYVIFSENSDVCYAPRIEDALSWLADNKHKLNGWQLERIDGKFILGSPHININKK